MEYSKHQQLMEEIKKILPKCTQGGSDMAHDPVSDKHLDLNYCQAMKERGELEKYLTELTK